MERKITEEEIMHFAQQLRKPEGGMGIEVGQRMNEGNGPMNLHTLAVLNPQPFDKILEIGMGNGLFVRNILKLDDSIHYTGCDYSETMVKEAVGINKDFIQSGQAEFIQVDITKSPFPDHSFNKIFTINTVYFWEDNAATLKELKRILTPGGELIIAIRPKHNMLQFPVTKYGFTLYAKDEISSLLQVNEFMVKEMTEIVEPPQEVWGQLQSRETLIVKSTPGN
jgi:ubiquinone/menaquinone biosynthesis C-methylase UbiE